MDLECSVKSSKEFSFQKFRNSLHLGYKNSFKSSEEVLEGSSFDEVIGFYLGLPSRSAVLSYYCCARMPKQRMLPLILIAPAETNKSVGMRVRGCMVCASKKAYDICSTAYGVQCRCALYGI